MPFIRSVHREATTERKARVALKEQKRRIRAHEAEQTRLVGMNPSHIPEIKTLRPRSRARREWLRAWISSAGFRYVRLPFSIEDYATIDQPAMARRDRRSRNRRANGWDPLAQAITPFCASSKWPWSSLPPFLLMELLDASHPLASRVLDVLEDDLDVAPANRFSLQEFLGELSLSLSYVEELRAEWTPSLPVDRETFAAGLWFAFGSEPGSETENP